MANSKQVEKILDRLGEVGFSEAYVRSLLPSWWDDSAASSPAGLSEFNLALSRNLGVEVEGLSAVDPRVEFRLPHVRKLKRSVRYNDAQLTPAVSVALSAARVAVQCVANRYTPLPSAERLRREILSDGNIKYLSLRALIRTCWNHGIPVLHVSRFPDGMPKMDGLAVVISGRPAIVLSKSTSFSAWMGFVLAHEMGHVACDHCADGEMIVDESLDETTYGDDTQDEQERQADNYAMALLAGGYDVSDLIDHANSPEELARVAMETQRHEGIDAGHLILKFAYQTKEWPLAIATLKAVDTKGRAIADILEAMRYELDADSVSKSSLAFLYRACGIPVVD
ncbi:MAG: ImmA/IrrE family metallo-endopeptidase [Chromatiaceae bacterium]|nr:ImmA/IrrE family metallo-endopeptidase [Chromatiaceae bacterium]MCP5315221.1 ImmA/IrrE family metallo-endopeptidase [Chromatiaceae bacterium]MCP5428645.1 ImmA/IrrE family metallo-endopeptidase [Chromatiaceae bacterium]